MKTMIKIIHILFLISTILLSMSSEDTNIGLLMEKNKGAISISSNLAITPQKPSSNKDIGHVRYMNLSFLLPNGMHFSLGNSLEENDRYNYLGFSYYLKSKGKQ